MALPDDDGVIDITIRLGEDVVEQISVPGRIVDHDHPDGTDPDHQHANIFRYYPLRATLPSPGIYDLDLAIQDAATAEVATATLPIQIFESVDARVPLPGEPFPLIDTPTIDRPEGVDRLCTRFEGICDFHTLNAAEAIGSGRPVALLVATPAFCSTAYCGPVLETLIAEAANHPDVDYIHVEVYANTDEVEGNFADPDIQLAPAVIDLGLTFEPALFLIDGDGTLVDRIDNVFDRTELADGLANLTA